MKRSINPRLLGVALIGAAAALTISLSACQVVPEPVPGQPMTAQQKSHAELVAQQEANERRRQERPCHPGDCMNR